jgi:hypothetical protein
VSQGKTASTHVLEPLEQTTFGKKYYVIDDAKHVWGADLDHRDAVLTCERVAGNLWSRTPTVKEMPKSAEVAAKIRSMVRGPNGQVPSKGNGHSPPLTPAQVETVRIAEGGLHHTEPTPAEVAEEIKALDDHAAELAALDGGSDEEDEEDEVDNALSDDDLDALNS